jgi:hypothetical protein
MHKARHTAGHRVLDKTGGNLKAVQTRVTFPPLGGPASAL